MTSSIYIAVAVVLGLLPAFIAQRRALPENRNRQFILYFVFGALLFVIALPFALMLKNENERRCSACAEKTQVTASVCPHCRADLTSAPPDADDSLASRMQAWWKDP